jgi:hypothetical protein
MLNTKNTSETQARYEFVKSKTQDLIKVDDGRIYKIDLDGAIQYFLELSNKQHFISHMNALSEAHGVLLDAEMPSYLTTKEYQRLMKSLEIIDLFMGRLIKSPEEE